MRKSQFPLFGGYAGFLFFYTKTGAAPERRLLQKGTESLWVGRSPRKTQNRQYELCNGFIPPAMVPKAGRGGRLAFGTGGKTAENEKKAPKPLKSRAKRDC